MSAGIIEMVARDSGTVLAPLTVQQYERMIEIGILPEGVPIELIDGLLVRKDRGDAGSPGMTVGTRHSSAVKKLTISLLRLVDDHAFHVQSQQPVTLSGVDQPEPDLAVIRGAVSDFASHHPGPADIVLVIEVADSSLSYDRTTKQRLYALAGIPLYWVVDLTTSRIEVHERPDLQQERYESIVRYGLEDAVPFTIGSQELELRVGDIL